MNSVLRPTLPASVTAALAALSVALIAATSAATNRYVSLDGHPVAPYTNWYNAATNISQALTGIGNGDVIIVSNGVYYLPTTICWDTTWAYRTVTITSLYGSAATILDGTGMVPNVNWPYGLYLNAPTIIHGFTFTNFAVPAIAFRDGSGTANHTLVDCVVAGNQGAGIHTAGGHHSAALSNCVIRGNAGAGIGNITIALQVDNSDICENRAGGIVASPVQGVIIRNSTIAGNTNAGNGGGISCNFGFVSNCVFMNNASTNGSGGGIYGNTTKDNCLIANNFAQADGGGSYGSGPLRNCTIIGNTSSNNGGGAWGGIIMQNSTIASNVAISGGGIFFGAASTAICCKITGNSSTTYRGGGMCSTVSTFPVIMDNCLIARNHTLVNNGGAAMYVVTPTTLRNCTIVSNVSTPASYGGGIVQERAVTLLNSIVYFNSGGAGVSNYADWGGICFTNCCTAPLPAKGTNNITFDPALVALPENCRLQKGSPCINAGLYQDWMNGTVDLDGRKRILDGMVDIGAYEWLPGGIFIMVR